MVKKNLVNKNVVRALSIGLSLAMASQPMMAMAADGNGNPGGSDGEVATQPTPSEVFESEVKSTTTETAMNSAINETQKAVNEVGTAEGKFGWEIDPSVHGAASQLAGEFDNNGGTPFKNDVQEEKDRLKGDAKEIADKEDELNEKADALDEMAEEGNGYVDTADGAVEDADEILTELEGKLDDAEAAFNEGKSALATAIANENQAAANAAYANAKKAVDDAKAAVEKANDEYASVKSDYEEAKSKYDTLAEEYRILLGQYNDAVAEYNRYKSAATGESTKLYNELGALKTKSENLEAAANEAKEKAESAKEELEGKKTEVDSTLKTLKENEYAQLLALENALKARLEDNRYGYDWLHNDPEFAEPSESIKGTYTEYIEAVIKLYYVTDVLKGTNATVTWVEDAQNHEYDYAEVVYTDENGQPATARLNGKLINNNNEHSFGGLVIYDMYEKVTETEDVYKAGNIDITDEIDKVGNGVYVDEEDNLLIAKKGHDQYVYAVGSALTTKEHINAGQFIDEESKETSYVYVDGKIKKIVTADIYKTTYDTKNVQLKGEATYESEEAAKAAYIEKIQAEINKLEEGQTLKVGSTVYVAGDIATDAGFEKTGGKETRQNVQDGFEMKATYYKQYTEGIAQESTDSYNSQQKAQRAGEEYLRKLSRSEKQTLIDSLVRELGTAGYVEDAGFIEYQDAERRPVYNLNTATKLTPETIRVETRQQGDKWVYEIIVAEDCTFVECETLERRGHWGGFMGTSWKWDETPAEFEARANKAGYVLEIKDNKAYYAPQKSTGSASQVVVINDQAEIDRLNALLADGVSKADAEEFAGAFNANALNADAVAEQAHGDHRQVEAFGAVVDPKSVKVHKSWQTVTSPFGFATVNIVKTTEKTVLVKEGKVIETAIWNTAAVQKTAGERIVEYTDANYYNGNVLFGTEYKTGWDADYVTDTNIKRYYSNSAQAQSVDYRYKLDHNASEITRLTGESESYGRSIEHKNKLIEQYEKIENQAKKAKEEAKKAQDRVDYLKGLLENVAYERDLVELKKLESDLEEAERRLNAAIERSNILQAALDELTVPTFGGGGEGGGEPGGDEGTIGTPAVLPAPTLLAGPVVGAPAAFVAAPAAAAGEGTIDIAEPQTALAAEVPEEKKEEPQLTTLPQQQTPLAAAPINEETLSWWWLLIIAVLGGAGYAMYKKFQTKKDEKTTN